MKKIRTIKKLKKNNLHRGSSANFAPNMPCYKPLCYIQNGSRFEGCLDGTCPGCCNLGT